MFYLFLSFDYVCMLSFVTKTQFASRVFVQGNDQKAGSLSQFLFFVVVDAVLLSFVMFSSERL